MIYSIVVFLCYVIFWPLHLVKVVGKENVPAGRGYMICANHSSLSDPIYLVMAVGTRPQIKFMAKKEIFSNRLSARFFRAVGAFPVDRDGADVSAIKESIRTLKDGGRLGVFPEGTRHAVERVKAGAGMLALRTGCEVLPVYIPEKKWRFKRLKVVVGKPFRPSAPEGKPTAEDYQRASEEIFESIEALADR